MGRSWARAVLGLDVVASVVVAVTVFVAPGEDGPAVRAAQLAFVLGTLCLAVVGAVVVARRPEQRRIGWLMLGVGALGAGARALTGLAMLDPTRTPDPVAWATNWAWVPGATAMLLLLLRIPTGELPSRRWRWVERLALGWGAVAVVVTAVVPGELAVTPLARPNPLGVAAAPWLNELLSPLFVLLPALVVTCAAASAVRYHRAGGEERAQLRWVGAAAVVLALTAPFAALSEAGALVEGLAYLLLPAGLTVAVLRHRLYELGIVVRRTVAYTVASAMLVGLYVGTVTVGQTVMGGRGPDVVASAVVAVAAVPLLSAVQRALERLFFGDRRDPDRVARQLAERLAGTAEELLPLVVAEVAHSLRLPYVAVELEDGAVAASAGPAGTVEGLRVPLRHGGRVLGWLVAGRRSPSEPLGGHERRLLERVASHAGLAVHSATLSRELRQTAARLRVARAEERARLQRDLHDGLGPALGAIAMRAEAARNLLRSASSPDRLDQVLASIEQQTEGAVGEVRRIIQDLQPQVLDEHGLFAALDQLAETVPEDLALTVTATDRRPLPPVVELAVYRIAAEALRNVVRHARARRADVTLHRSDGELELTVADDGVGLGDDPFGVGMTSMRARAEQLGGRLEVTDGPGAGTVVSVTIPLEGPTERSGAVGPRRSAAPRTAWAWSELEVTTS